MNLRSSNSYAIEQITRLLLEMRDNCAKGDGYNDPKRHEKYDALNAVIDMIDNPSVLFEKMHDGDLISREALMKLARNHVGHVVDCNDIARFPAVDAVPVVHGEWRRISDRVSDVYCSECKVVQGLNHIMMRFCPNCGAKMDEEADDALD